ncbi:hypothetical protein LTR85_001095 [Meristemomyces frigidus]|nr:hypothetical protein LTR85_001095 [Meristemomyces frigidus]
METPLAQRRRRRSFKTDKLHSKQESNLRHEIPEGRYAVQDDYAVRRPKTHQKSDKRFSWTALLGLVVLVVALWDGAALSRDVACWPGQTCTHAPNEITSVVTRMNVLIGQLDFQDLNYRKISNLTSNTIRIHYDAQNTGFANHDRILSYSTVIFEEGRLVQSGTRELQQQVEALAEHASAMRTELDYYVGEVLPDAHRGFGIHSLVWRLPGQSYRSPGYQVMRLFGYLIDQLEVKVSETSETGGTVPESLYSLENKLQLLVGVLDEELEERTAQCADYDTARFGFKALGRICRTDPADTRSLAIDALSVVGPLSEIVKPLVKDYNAWFALVEAKNAEFLEYLDPSHTFDREVLSVEEATRRVTELRQALIEVKRTWNNQVDAEPEYVRIRNEQESARKPPK